MRNRIYIGDTSPTLMVGCENNLYLINDEDTNRKEIL